MDYAQTYLTDQTDIDRLHHILEHGCSEYDRGCGRTYATLMLMLGEGYLGGPDSTYLYIGENMNIAWHWVGRAFYEIMTAEGHDMKITRGAQILDDRTTGCRFIVRGPSHITHWMRGYRFSKTYIDLTSYSFDNHRQEMDELRYRSDEIYYG